MDLGSCKIKWNSAVSIQQVIRCEPDGAEMMNDSPVFVGSLSGAIISVLRMPKNAAELARIHLDEEVLGERMSDEYSSLRGARIFRSRNGNAPAGCRQLISYPASRNSRIDMTM